MNRKMVQLRWKKLDSSRSNYWAIVYFSCVHTTGYVWVYKRVRKYLERCGHCVAIVL